MSIEANEFELKTKPFQLDAFLQDLLELIAIQAKRKSLTVNVQKRENVPPILHSDEARLQQILLILLLNSIKFTNKGFITVAIERDEAEKNMIKFQVSDTGIGIPFEKKVQLFKLFGGDNTTSLIDSKTKRGNFGYSSYSWVWTYNQ